jgi:hypothetical protein
VQQKKNRFNVLVVKKNQRLKIKFLFVDSGEVYDPTLSATPIDVTVSVVRGDNRFSAIIRNPISYLYTNATPDTNAYIERTVNSEFIFNYKVPEGMYPGMYTAVAKTVNGNSDIIIESKFEVKEEAYEPLPTVPMGNKSSVVTYKPSYEDINFSNMQSLLLVGHADGLELNSPIKIRSVQHAVELLNADMNSPLLRGAFDAYDAGAKNIFICAAAPMSEYVDDIDKRLISSTYIDYQSATPTSKTFYERYYERLSVTYSVLSVLDFIDVIVPLEVSIIKTGGIDFVSQLATYCNSFHNETGYVQIGVIGSRTNGITSEDIDEIENDESLSSKFTEYNISGNIISDFGRYVVPVYGEALFSHAQLDTTYINSVSAAVAGLIVSNPLNFGLVRKRIPGAMSVYGVNLNSLEMNRLDAIGINTIYRGNKARRAQPFQVYLTNDYTMANINSIFSKLPQMRLASYLSSSVKGFGYDSIGKFGYDKVINNTTQLLKKLKQDGVIVDYEFNAKPSSSESGVILLYINIVSSLGLKKINLSLAAGPGA